MLQVARLGDNEPRERVICYRSAEPLLVFPTSGGMARLSRPTAIVCNSLLTELLSDSNVRYVIGTRDREVTNPAR